MVQLHSLITHWSKLTPWELITLFSLPLGPLSKTGWVEAPQLCL